MRLNPMQFTRRFRTAISNWSASRPRGFRSRCALWRIKPPSPAGSLYNSRNHPCLNASPRERGVASISLVNQLLNTAAKRLRRSTSFSDCCGEDADVIGRFLLSKTANDIRAEVEKRIAQRNVSTSIDPPLSLYCKRTIAYAAEEAERLSHRHINTDHLLIGVVREEDGMAGQILRSAGLNVVAMRQQRRLDEAATQ